MTMTRIVGPRIGKCGRSIVLRISSEVAAGIPPLEQVDIPVFKVLSLILTRERLILVTKGLISTLLTSKRLIMMSKRLILMSKRLIRLVEVLVLVVDWRILSL